ncbi:MAG: alpha-L-glutamate ligase-like protein [Spongiibacteraceae bacterium]|jgi:alpha-L-glutamate ligase-like protein|nr:alpha-L-glutamate ligase-like protein [Spongiibacteraceae bacterium]
MLFGLLVSPWRLRQAGILGMNARNANYIARYNPRALYPVVDHKLKTKKACHKAGIATPRLLGYIETLGEVDRLMRRLADMTDFVIKPSRGSGGKGIVVVAGRDGPDFLKPSGARMTVLDIRRHISDILSGLYSLGGKPDSVMVEQRVDFDPVFDDYSFEGVPDIRVIVFKGFPVMAMMRCSTHASDGRANLHQGAVGVGLDIRSGRSIHAVQRGNPVTEHPDTKRPFRDLRVPNWEQLLLLATRCQDATRLGYIGCDLVLDRKLGPLVLELNARPGLSIQIANGAGLLPRLQAIEALGEDELEWPAEKRVAYSRSLFGHARPRSEQAA